MPLLIHLPYLVKELNQDHPAPAKLAYNRDHARLTPENGMLWRDRANKRKEDAEPHRGVHTSGPKRTHVATELVQWYVNGSHRSTRG